MSEPKTSDKYQKQHRGNVAAYESYFAGMDASMQQKVALTTAHFPSRGKIADMGSGSGRGTFDLACLYDGLELVGVDINPVSVEMSKKNYQQSNLSYAVGDIAEKVFEDETLDGILDSSVLHHVTSFNNFDVNRVMLTFDNQIAQLKTGGVLIIRDFVIPDDGEEEIYLDLPNELSELFEKFTQEFRSSVNTNSPVPYKKMSASDRLIRYQITLRAAAEFVLRKDYRADWATEILEEYTYLSQSEFEKAFRERGMRIVVSMPLWNPWIVQNRFIGKFFLYDMEEKPLPFPPTNYLIVGERVSANAGVELIEQERREITEPKFLKLKAYRDTATNQIWELVERPNCTIDLLPWFEDDGQIFVLARKDYPRPIVNACIEQPPLHRANYSGYITEPITALVDSSLYDFESALEVLKERVRIESDEIISHNPVFQYYTSPGGINELVHAFAVQLKSWNKPPQPAAKTTPFTETGTIRDLDAVQVLRASQVGGMFDARLEINIYRLLLSLKRSVGPWIGAALNFTEQTLPGDFQNSDESILNPSKQQTIFEPCDLPDERFLSVHVGKFVEKNSKGEVLAETEFEYVIPRVFSEHTVVAIPVIKTHDEIFIGIEHRNLPAAGSFNRVTSYLACIPAWRLPKNVTHVQELDSFIKQAMKKDFNLSVNFTRELGGAYFASPGITPELVYPLAVEIEAEDISKSNLKWIKIKNLVGNIDKADDAHTIIAAYRLAHAIGLFSLPIADCRLPI
jgi:SAM-dependent methyltransferase